MKKRNESFHTIREIVTANTGMTVEQLLNDEREWSYDYSEFFRKLKEMNPERIIIVGDYDDDGVWSTATMDMTLTEMGYRVYTRLPRRLSEGYGAKPCQLEPFNLTERDLVLTVDNGIAAFEAVDYAKNKGATVVIMDHHQPKIENGQIVLPNADIIYDGHFDGKTNFKDWCAGGMATMFCLQAPVSRKTKNKALVGGAIATIGDSVTLVDGNRWMVKEGIRLMNTDRESLSMGLFALMTAMKCEGFVDEMTIGYSLVPCINAAGRLLDDGAERAFQLVTFEGNFSEAMNLAEELVLCNTERKNLTSYWTGRCYDFVEKKNYEKEKVILVENDSIHEGVVGILAGKLMEKYDRPAFVFTKHAGDETLIKGSGRSAQGVNMKELLDQHQDLLYAYGGHAGAAGVTLKMSNFQAFREALNNTLKDTAYNEDSVVADLIIDSKELPEIISEYNKFGPYGEGNPAPVIFIKNYTLYPIKGSDLYMDIGTNGIKMANQFIQAVSFFGADEYREMGSPTEIGLLGTIGKNYYNEELKDQFFIEKFLPAETNKENIIKTPFQLMLEKRNQKGA